jgi:DNA (cytosine-5)-methyltransferase 1
MRPPALRLLADELLIDNFAGGGGASTGIEGATARSPDFAINHDPKAIAMHAANHPKTRHFCEDVFHVNPREVVGSRTIGLAWFSPDCTYFSKARGAKPFRDRDAARRRRGLAGVVIKWASLPRPKKPRIILMENVEEFQQWGPLDRDGMPDPLRAGLSFRRWLAQLRNCGFEVQFRELVACDYGAPTKRKRLFVIARSDGRPIVWPKPTHGPGRLPYRAAAECIDFARPVHSIFLTPAEAKKVRVIRPLAEKTMARIARGTFRYVLNAPQPFVIPLTHAGAHRAYPVSGTLPTITSAHRGELALIAPFFDRYYSERPPYVRGARAVDEPMPTITASGNHQTLAAAFLAKHYGGHENDGAQLGLPMSTTTTRDHHALVTSHLMKMQQNSVGQDMREPMHTVMAGATRFAEVRAFLLKWYGNEKDGEQIDLPLGTVTTKDRFGLVTVHGERYAIADICMRMLRARELFNAQSFPREYILDVTCNGRALTETDRVALCGNAVPPVMGEVLARANLSDNPVGLEGAA